jgi:hypothetical protein
VVRAQLIRTANALVTLETVVERDEVDLYVAVVAAITEQSLVKEGIAVLNTIAR